MPFPHAEHAMVVLSRDFPAVRLHAGDVGAVVHVYNQGAAYEVEFVDGEGATIALLTLAASDVRTLAPGEMLHTRRRDLAEPSGAPHKAVY